MRELLSSVLLLGLTSLLRTAECRHAVLRNTDRPWLEDQKNSPREYKLEASHRNLQRTAGICAANPTSFSTSIYVDHVGDKSSFQQADLDVLLQMALLSFNQVATETCDATFRTLQAVSVSNVYYSSNLDFVRLRYDLTGQCDGCVPGDPESGIGPLFGAFEQSSNGRERRTQQTSEEAKSGRSKRIKGLHNKRQLQNQQDARKTKSKYNPCYCSDSRSRGRGPTPSEWALAFNDMIQAARRDGALSGVMFVEDVFEAGIAGVSTVLPTNEARQASCANQKDFTTDVWVEFEMGRDLKEAEKLPMEVALLETFNEMILVSCDVPFFRRVSDVTHVLTRSTQDKLQMKFAVSGKCVNCNPAAVDLFDTNPQENINPNLVVNVQKFRPPAGNLLMSEISRLQAAQSESFTVYRDTPTSCVCPLNQEGLPLRSPTTREFAQILQDTINTLRLENRITSVSQVTRVEEHDIDATCSSDVSTFVSTVFADFAGRPEDLAPTEISTLEGGFKTTYDNLIFNSCDQYFRTISGVRLIPGVSGRRRKLQASNVGNAANSTDVPDLQSEAPSVYMVAGECRGCPVRGGGSFSLLDDAFRFRKLMVGNQEETVACYTYGKAVNGLPDIRELSLPAGEGDAITKIRNEERRLEQCLCAPGAFPDAPFAPKPEDFKVDYNSKIMEYNKKGEVEAVQEVTQIEEVPPGFVEIPFTIFYGTLQRLENPTDADYKPLVQQTNSFYRRLLREHYGGDNLRAVTILKEDTIVRRDLNMLQVDFTAELIFSEVPVLPTPEEVTVVMAGLSYVDYITDFVWALNKIVMENGRSSVFRRAHSVRFAGRENRMARLGMVFTVKSSRTNRAPNIADRQGLGSQVNQFFLNYLKDSGLSAVSFTSHIHAEDVSMTGNGLVSVDFESTVVFSTETEPPSDAELMAILQSADLGELKEQLLTASPVLPGVFDSALDIAFTETP